MRSPIDPCGLAVDVGRFAGSVDMRFWNDSDEVQRCQLYFVPRDRGNLPIPHSFLLQGFTDALDPQPVPTNRVGDEGPTFRAGWQPALGWGKAGLHFCGSPRQWLEGSRDGDPLLEWTDHGFSTCCDGVFSLGTPNQVAKFGADGMSVVNSRIADPGAGNITIESALDALVGLILRDEPGGEQSGLFQAINTGLARYLTLTAYWHSDQTYEAYLVLQVNDDFARLVISNSVPGRRTLISLDGADAPDIAADGWDVRSGLVYAVPDASDLEALLSLGSAAFQDTAAFDAAGTASAAVASHEGEADPHPDYLLEATAATTYQPLSGSIVRATRTTNQALAANTVTPVVFDSEAQDAGGEYDPTTGTFTPSATGLYALSYGVALSGANRCLVELYTTGAALVQRMADAAAAYTLAGTTLVQLTGGTGYQVCATSIGAGDTVSGGGAFSFLAIRRMF